MPRLERTILLYACVLLSAAYPSSAAEMSPEAVIARHLESLGRPDVRSAAKSRVVEAAATYRLLVGGSGAIDGKAVLASEGNESNFLLKINTVEYRGEQFICDGQKAFTAGTYSDKSRSDLGGFLRGEDIVIREGLLGGVWSTAWPLLDIKARGAKVKYQGLKKIDGRELQTLSYRPKKSTDLEILLFFDPQTFQHVMTTYKASMRAGIASTDIDTPHQQETRYRIEERFSDFQTTDGLTLPTRYELNFTEELANGFTKSVEWDVKALRVLNNISLDPRNFVIK